MKTIIQTIGPLYGEVVNGTVFGQPNGSEARPPQNIPSSIVLAGDSVTLEKKSGVQILNYDINGMTAVYDLPVGFSKIIVYAYKQDGSTLIGSRGFFSIPDQYATQGPGNLAPSNGDSVRIRITALDEYGQVIATSNDLAATAVMS